MKIIIVGDRAHFEEARQKFYGMRCVHIAERTVAADTCQSEDLIFDFTISDHSAGLRAYAPYPVTVFLNTCYTTLAALQITDAEVRCRYYGFNGMATLFNREYLEISAVSEHDIHELAGICTRLSTEYAVVVDRIGMVTPRVICMIINEAYYTVQDGTATREDVDIAMKLGTNYPFGPFDWSRRIGLRNVCRLLDSVYRDTKDPRYVVAPLLKKEAATAA